MKTVTDVESFLNDFASNSEKDVRPTHPDVKLFINDKKALSDMLYKRDEVCDELLCLQTKDFTGCVEYKDAVKTYITLLCGYFVNDLIYSSREITNKITSLALYNGILTEKDIDMMSKQW